MNSPSAARQMAVLAVSLLAFTPANQAEVARPDFTGFWRVVSITVGPVGDSVIEIKQSESTVSMRPLIHGKATVMPTVYALDGKVITTKVGRQLITTIGYWDGNQLVLQETGPGNAPWQRSTEQRTLSLSTDGRRLTMRIHNLSDKKSVHDYATESERVKE